MSAQTEQQQKTDRSYGLWRRTAVRTVLVPLFVLLPLITLAPTADHRFNVYWHGADFRMHPFAQLSEPFRTIPRYLGFGNFRPLGRLLERAVDIAAYLFVEVLHLPVEVGLRLVSFAAAIVLTAAAVLLCESVVARGRLFRRPPSRLTLLVPFAAGPGFVAAGGTSTTVLFGGLYFLSAALVLTVAAVLCRQVAAPHRGRWTTVAAVLAGAGLAAFNEIAYLALPVAVLAVLVRGRLVLGIGMRDLIASRAGRLTGWLWAGFLPVFLPVRVLIARACRDGGCYRGSDLVLGPDVGSAWLHRMVSWVPPAQWHEATRHQATYGWVLGLLPLLALLALTVLAVRTALDLRSPAVPRRADRLAVAALAGGILALGSLLAATNGDMQAAAATGRWGLGWRDSGMAAAAGALLIVALATRLRIPFAMAGLVAAGTLSAGANAAFLTYAAGTPEAITNNAIAQEIAQFDRSPAGDERRCALLARFRALYPDSPYSTFARAELPGTTTPTDRLAATAGMATMQLDGRRFCSRR